MRNTFLTKLLCCVLAASAWGATESHIAAQTQREPIPTFTGNIAAGNHSWLNSRTSKLYPGIVKTSAAGSTPSNELSMATAHPNVRKAPLATTADGTEIWGLLIYADDWASVSETTVPYGVYKFEAPDMTDRTLLGEVGYANGGGSFSNNTLRYTAYGLESTLVAYYYEYDINTWSVTEQPRTMDGHMITVCSAFDPTSYKTYAVYYGDDFNAEKWNFGTIDYDMETTTKLSEMTNICIAMACDNDGQLYGITVDGYLNTIDKQTGAFTRIGNTGLSVKSIMQSAIFDRNNGKLYWAAMTADNGAALYEVDTTTGKANFVANFPNREEPVALFIPRSYNASAPSEASNLSLIFKGANTNGAIQFDAPSTDCSGKKLSGDLSYTVKANGQIVATGEAEVGEESATVPVKNLTDGYTTFEVTLSNNNGEGKSAYLKKWIGKDVPQSPQEAEFTVDTKNNNYVKLTWAYPQTGGTHGGYADPSDFTYRIVRYPGGTVVADGITDRTFTENVPQSKWAAHYYEVYAINNGLVSEPKQSNIISFGDALDLPYANNISSKEDFSEFELIDRGDGYTWDFIQGVEMACAYCRATSETEASNAWLLTPPMNMRKGYEYELNFQAWANWNEDEKMGVYLGTGSDTTEFKQNVIDDVHVYNGKYDDRTSRSVRFGVNSDNGYRIGFNCVSDPASEYLMIDSIAVREVLCYEAPDSVHNLKVVASADGSQEAAISFDAPTKRNNGNALTTITKIEVSRDGEVFKTYNSPEPGTHFELNDREAVNGTTTYEVVAYNEADKGLAAQVTLYVGLDIPLKPTGVKLVDNFDGTVTLSWNKVTKGVNNCYIPQGEVTYNVYSIKNGTPVTVKSDIEDTTVVISGITQSGQQTRFYYGVQSQTEAGNDGYTLSNPLLSGAPYTMPYYESFTNASQQNGPWTVSTKGSGTLGLTNTTTEDNDLGAIVCYPKALGFEGYLSTPKISLSNSNHPVGSFYYYCTPGKDMGINVMAIREGGDTVNVKTFDFASEEGTTGYRIGKFDLSSYKNDHYVQVLFNFYFNETGTSLLIDNIAIEDMKANDLKASIAIPVSVRNGQSATSTVTVENIGENVATGYTVKLYKNGIVVDSKTGEAIASGKSADFDMNFTASKISTSSIELFAKVEYDNDEDESNNTTSTHTVFVYAPTYPTITDLAANGQQLTWTAISNADAATTDGFETYYPLEANNIGDWTTIDVDGGEPYTFGLAYVEQFRKPSAYVVNNPTALGSSDEAWAAHEGNQYLQAFAVSPNTTANGTNDDWLISPLLSGKAQTIKAWVKSYNSTYGLEDYEVLYSTTGKATADFTQLAIGEAPTEWTEISYGLPEGAKYFAIRHTSADKYIFMLDDVTYIPGGMTVKGYNVYRDGELLASLSADATSYTDNDATYGSHDYVVTVIYEIGESGASNMVSIVFTGIGSTSCKTTVTAANGHIAIRCAAGKAVEVVSTSGIKMLATSDEDNLDIAVAPGVYLVKVGNQTYNISVGK